jgi:hypothetical protein
MGQTLKGVQRRQEVEAFRFAVIDAEAIQDVQQAGDDFLVDADAADRVIGAIGTTDE